MSEAPEVTTTLIVTAGTIIVSIIGVISGWVISRGKAKTPAPIAATEVAGLELSGSPLATFSGTPQNEFMRLVLEDNALLRADLTSLRDAISALTTRTAAAELKQEETEERLEEAVATHGEFARAVRHYLEELVAAWPGPDPMPAPSPANLAILEPSLPRRRRSSRPS